MGTARVTLDLDKMATSIRRRAAKIGQNVAVYRDGDKLSVLAATELTMNRRNPEHLIGVYGGYTPPEWIADDLMAAGVRPA